MFLNQDFEWEELNGLKGLALKEAVDYLHKITNMKLEFSVAGYIVDTFEEVIEILAEERAYAAEEDCEPDNDVSIYIGGENYVEEIVVEFEDGKVARWYRSEYEE